MPWIFIVAFLIRVAIQYNTGAFIHPQTWEYEVAVNNFLQGRGLTYEIYGTTYYSLLTPLYPAVCIMVYVFTNHSFFVLLIIQALLSSLTCEVIFLIGRALFGKNAGLLAAVLVALHPGFIIYSTKLHPFVLDSFLFCLIIWLLIATKRESSPVNQLKLGISFGLACLTRPTILLFFPFSWLWLRRNSKQSFFLYIFVTLTAMSPWLARNYLIHKKIMIVSSSANVFWRGNNPLATGTSLGPTGKPMLEEAKDVMTLIYGRSELEQSKVFFKESFKFIKDNQARFMELTLRKFFYFCWFAPTSGSEYKKEWLAVYKVLYYLIFTFAILGIFNLKSLAYPIKYSAFLIILFMFIIAIAQSMFYVETRHRWAIEPLLLIFTANGLRYIKDGIRNRILLWKRGRKGY